MIQQQEEKKTILVVDDDEEINQALSLVLRSSGYQTILMTEGKDLKKFILGHKPIHLILLDIRLLNGDGLKITEDLKSDPLTKEIPIILISARVGSLTDLHGADRYLPKPFRIKELLAEISELV